MRYEEYKGSGIEWIGEVPSHWVRCRFKDFTSLQTTASLDEENKIGLENIEGKTGRFIESFSDFEGNGIQFEKGDIVYGKLRPYLQKVWIATFSGNAVGDFFIFRAKDNCNNKYLFYTMLSDGFTSLCNGATLGAKMPRVSSDFIRSMHLYLPPIKEQQAIASYLDEKCSKINGAIDVQKNKIDLLNELKQTIITNVVTKGLNPDAPMKNSGVEWIGEVPAHWEVKRLKYNSKFINGFAFKSDLFSDDGEYPVIRIGDIYNDGISYDNIVYVPQNSELDNYKVRDNDILIAMSGATVGKVGLCNSSDVGYINQRVGIVRSDIYKLIWYNLLSPKFLEYIYLMSDGSAQPNISSKGIRDYYIAIPPHEEQQGIIEYLTKEVSKIDAQISKANRRIELLNEFKQSTITEAVTGKIKVC